MIETVVLEHPRNQVPSLPCILKAVRGFADSLTITYKFQARGKVRIGDGEQKEGTPACCVRLCFLQGLLVRSIGSHPTYGMLESVDF